MPPIAVTFRNKKTMARTIINPRQGPRHHFLRSSTISEKTATQVSWQPCHPWLRRLRLQRSRLHRPRQLRQPWLPRLRLIKRSRLHRPDSFANPGSVVSDYNVPACIDPDSLANSGSVVADFVPDCVDPDSHANPDSVAFERSRL